MSGEPANDNGEYTAEFIAEAEAYLASLSESSDERRARELAGQWQAVYDAAIYGEIDRDEAVARLAPIRAEMTKLVKRLGDWPQRNSIALLAEVGFGDGP
jgi:hypothetical protein